VPKPGGAEIGAGAGGKAGAAASTEAGDLLVWPNAVGKQAAGIVPARN